ncbi:hypothetical protein A3H38_05815 [candidate division WOR-1 bacterium RIFCSPLOWO2_02_FULL_46_20]|uniref:IPT/TIG domain-containing protein n=1 Tax=candidate division WOR-1 bacterium RIFCSPLOWO2_02_FULL_46_20 TaxID=1802567 RepID=A0A1F4RBE5_UNCSA|nr:MAG: hypothetical protein A3J44_05115 [candidate division WOR-1 bacterium RIFCSPHIGHO2_02_FULL_45_12]OGC05480.1 MAG: hypothetical protein A3H38_05815 [candidate division WOR-1 bacterium RIFCSPLOWO2_02_FULL_46_20]
MKKTVLIVLAILWCGASFAVSNSTSYKLTAQAFGAGTAVGTSTSFSLRGIARGLRLGEPYNSNYKIGEGFLKCVRLSLVILAPNITSIGPQSAVNDGSVSLTVNGYNFVDGATLKLSSSGEADIAATNVTVHSTTKITCLFDITDVTKGLWSITITNPDGRSGTLPLALDIRHRGPEVGGITPKKAYDTGNVAVEISGKYFISGARAMLSKPGEGDIIGTNIVVKSSTKITCQFDLTGKAAGRWDVKVENEDGKGGSLSEGFKVEKEVLEVEAQISKPTAIPGMPEGEIPAAAASISYELSQDAEIMIQVFTMRGEMIWSTVLPMGSEGGQAGENNVVWNGITSFKSVAGAGVYFVRIYRVVDGQKEFIKQMKYGVIHQ